MFQRSFGQADRVRKLDLRWDIALRDLQIQVELKITRVRPHFAVRLLKMVLVPAATWIQSNPVNN